VTKRWTHWSADLLGLVLLVVARLVVNTDGLRTGLNVTGPAWFRAVEFAGLFRTPDNLLAWLGIAFLVFAAVKYFSRDSSLRRGLALSLLVLALDVVVIVVSPEIGEGVRWTTPLSAQWVSLAMDIGGVALVDLIFVFGLANGLSTAGLMLIGERGVRSATQ
jgi:hypothetical protein